MPSLKAKLARMPVDQRRSTLQHLAAHLTKAAQIERLQLILTDFEFLEAKIAEFSPQLLIEDYDLALQPNLAISQRNQENLRLIQGALRLSTNILSVDKNQLAQQLWGRLIGFENPVIYQLLQQTQQLKSAPWLRPLTTSFAPPSNFLVRTLSGHSNWVNGVAVTSEGKIVSGSEDKTLKVWALETGEELLTLYGHHG